MVLLERRYWEPDSSLPANPNDQDEMWVLETTGELFGDYSDYLKALYLTKSRLWSSVYTGVSNLTYQEAILEDERGRALARKFPQELEAQALQHVHFGTLRLDDLIEYLYNALKPRQPAVAPQGLEHAGQPLKLKHPAPRPVVRCWLFEVALHDQVGGCQNFWRAKPEYVQKYNLTTVVPQDVQEVLAVARARHRPRRGGGGARKRSRGMETPATRAASEAPSESGSMDWAVSSQAGEEEVALANGNADTSTPSLDEKMPSVEEEEAKIKPGTDKHVAFQALKEAGSGGLNVDQIMEAARQSGITALDDNSKRVIQYALANDPAFQRTAKGVYTLRALAPEINSPVPQPKTKGQRTPRPPPPRFDPSALTPEPSVAAGLDDAGGDDAVPLDFLDGSSVLAPMPAGTRPEDVHIEAEYIEPVKEEAPENGEALGPGAAMDAALARLNRAEEDVAALREAIKAAQARARMAMPKKKKKGEDSEDANPVFEVSAEEKVFKGDPNDRKALLRHKQHVKELEEEAETAKQAWLKKQRSMRDKASGNKSKEVQALNKQLQAALQVLDVERYHVAACEEAAMSAEKGHGRGRRGSWARRFEYEDPLKAAEREERDRRRAEVRRYPIDDTELHAELRDKAFSDGGDMPEDDVPTATVERIDAATSHAMSATMYVADFASTFHLPLGLPQPVHFRQLQDAIAAEGQLDGREALWELYEGIMRFLLNNTTGRTERRWLNCLGAATWPEVVRRYCLFHMAKFQDPQITDAANLLGDQGCETLTASLHRCLLCHLCDEALDREPLRALLTRRMDWAENVRKEMRDAAAEDKGRIKELIEARKEERKRKRAEGKGRAGAAAWEEEVKLEGADSGLGDLENGDGPDHRYSSGVLGEDSAAEDADMLDAEPQRGGKGRRGKGKAGNPRAEANRQLERQQAEMEDATIRRQEEFERALDECCIRREPLGWDRKHRCYWWGVAGERTVVYVQDWNGHMGALSTPEELDALMDALEPRGVREHGLQSALEKMYHSITNAMTLGPGEMLEPVSYGVPAPQMLQNRRASKRGDRAGSDVDLAPEKHPQQISAEKPRPACLAGVEGLAILTSADFLLDIHRLAVDNDIEPSTSCVGGWKVWAPAVRFLGQGHLPPGSTDAGPLVPALRDAMKSRLIQMEEALFIASGQRFEAESEAAAEAAYLSKLGGRDSEEREGSQERVAGEGDADANGGASGAEDGVLGGEAGGEDAGAKPQGGGLRMWRAARDRAAWKADVLHATTAARVAYSAVALTIIGYPLLDKIEAIRTMPVPKPRGGGVTAELEAAAAAGAAAAAAALKGARAKKGDDDTINTRNKATRR
ncbi:hypothetical protein CVIRNUC_002033 [Coccomyxa viridis]|uniref:WAC domain-containing protein n=1 Tax=Coccomyxa viridis TaxID=1274662 RepID=A0AAV1HVR6_9CHLO|nr:hypothetical protein CVIRNUC_002033 [Coccomyxa viridis]